MFPEITRKDIRVSQNRLYNDKRQRFFAYQLKIRKSIETVMSKKKKKTFFNLCNL